MSLLNKAKAAAVKGGTTFTPAPASGYYVASFDAERTKIAQGGSLMLGLKFEGYSTSKFVSDPSATLQKPDNRAPKWALNECVEVGAIAENLGLLQTIADSDADFDNKKPSPPSAKRLDDAGFDAEDQTTFAQAQAVFGRLSDPAWMTRQSPSQVVVKWAAPERGARNKKGGPLYGEIQAIYPVSMLAELRAGPPVEDIKGFAGAPAATGSSASTNAAAASADVPGDEDIPF
jgi:hypothetical protein